MTACALCPRTAPDGQQLCPVHAGELRRLAHGTPPHQIEVTP